MTNLLIIVLLFISFIFITLSIKWILDHSDTEEKLINETESKNQELPSKDILSDSYFKMMLKKYDSNNLLEIPLGFNEKEIVETIDLEKNHNILIIGTTGSGKSIAQAEIISSIMMLKKESEIKISTIDTSMVELSSFNNIPHYVKDTIITPTDIIEEFDNLLNELNHRRLQIEKTPLIVIIDDLYDVCTYDKSIKTKLIQLLTKGPKEKMFFIISTDTPTKELLSDEFIKHIDSTIYLTLSPGSEEEFVLNLTKKELDFTSTIGNAIYQINDIKKRIIIPEVGEDDIKRIKSNF